EGQGSRSGGDVARRAEDRAEGLPQGSSPDRAAPVQGAGGVARVAGRRMARNQEGEGPPGRVLPAVAASRRVAASHRGSLDPSRADAIAVGVHAGFADSSNSPEPSRWNAFGLRRSTDTMSPSRAPFSSSWGTCATRTLSSASRSVNLATHPSRETP